MAIAIPRRRAPDDLQPSAGATELVANFEGYSSDAYPDPASDLGRRWHKKLPQLLEQIRAGRLSQEELDKGKPWTIGFGFTHGVKPGDVTNIREAVERLEVELKAHAVVIPRDITVPLTQGEFDALASLAFNLGRLPQTLRTKLNAGDYAGAQAEFPRNCRAGGRPLLGLYRRRLAEACLWDGLPWRMATDRKNVVLKVTPGGQIDYGPDATTTLEEALMLARQDPNRAPAQWEPDADLFEIERPPPEPEYVPTADDVKLDTPAPVIDLPEFEAEEEPLVLETPAPPVTPPPAPAPPPPPALPRDPIPPTSDPKDMVLSRRFWGLVAIIIAMLNFWPSAIKNALNNPAVLELFSWVAVAGAGAGLNWWGKRRATRNLK